MNISFSQQTQIKSLLSAVVVPFKRRQAQKTKLLMKLHPSQRFPPPDCLYSEDVWSWGEEQRVSQWRCEWKVEFIGSLRLCIFRGCVICGMIWVRRINLGEARWNAERVIMLRQEHHPQPSQEEEKEEKPQSRLSKRSVILKASAGTTRKSASGADTSRVRARAVARSSAPFKLLLFLIAC